MRGRRGDAIRQRPFVVSDSGHAFLVAQLHRTATAKQRISKLAAAQMLADGAQLWTDIFHILIDGRYNVRVIKQSLPLQTIQMRDWSVLNI